ncbi:hypothetical protein [Prochlorococcus marinus]|uniref:Uncharacterized protein n=1 Tax=Prochlorococcus marinus str. PAC1 TaxID=59924 RepID=A0A0A2C7R2_PROMR|nr:hypothetical protein [Prochlorococcus marinus]KGG22411.1 hypothetical protein EV03_0081 [Prochlorococcus marinus str. PAC1]
MHHLKRWSGGTIHQMRILSEVVMHEIILVVGVLLLFILLHESTTNKATVKR